MSSRILLPPSERGPSAPVPSDMYENWTGVDIMYYLDGRRRCQSLVYFGNSKGSSANVAAGQCLPGASRVSSRAATRKQMVAANDYDELRICKVVCFIFRGGSGNWPAAPRKFREPRGYLPGPLPAKRWSRRTTMMNCEFVRSFVPSLEADLGIGRRLRGSSRSLEGMFPGRYP